MPRAKLSKAALFELVGYEPHPGQLAVHRSGARLRVICAGSRWGKSVLTVHEALAALMEPRAKATCWIVAPVLEVSKRLFEHVHGLVERYLPHRIVQADPRQHTLTVLNLGGGRSVLRARSTDMPAGLLGESLDFLAVDEATRVRDHVWHGFLAPRLLDRQGQLLAVSTPSNEGWFHTLFERGVRGEAGCESWRRPTSQNPTIDPAWIEAERERLPEATFAELYEARFQRERGFGECNACGGLTRESYPSWGYYGPEDGLNVCGSCHFVLDERGQPVGAVIHGRPERGKVLHLLPDPVTDARLEAERNDPDYQARLDRMPLLVAK